VVQSGILSVVPYGTGVLLSLVATLGVLRFARGRQSSSQTERKEFGEDGEIFHLRGGRLIQANFEGRRQLDCIIDGTSDEMRLRQLLSSRFDGLDDLLAKPDKKPDLSASSRDGNLQIIREVAGDEVRLQVTSRQTVSPGRRDMHCLDAERDELNMLRSITKVAPFHVWRQNSAGEVIWANQNYLEAVTQVFGTRRTSMWPIPHLFKDLGAAGTSGNDHLRRVQLNAASGEVANWYDCHLTRLGNETLCTAFRADEAVKSESRRREFTQTLTKTFSDLTIGLAIFDRSRRLALFNPAATDLTSLPVDFLTSRPSLVGFLDQLRENRVMPEPRDYRSWRKSISDLENAAMNGTYAETWSLPDGQTYRVTGRPHPDGAMALLFEDISAEMSLTRRFRAQLEQSQAIIDSLDDAVALFSTTGEMTFSNTAYKELWDDPSEESVLGSTVVDATRKWHQMTVPTPVWGDFRDFAFHNRERNEWTATVAMRDGRQLSCRFAPQKGGSSLVIFSILSGKGVSSKQLREAV
jgi:PAS domain-containing protein